MKAQVAIQPPTGKEEGEKNKESLLVMLLFLLCLPMSVNKIISWTFRRKVFASIRGWHENRAHQQEQHSPRHCSPQFAQFKKSGAMARATTFPIGILLKGSYRLIITMNIREHLSYKSAQFRYNLCLLSKYHLHLFKFPSQSNVFKTCFCSFKVTEHWELVIHTNPTSTAIWRLLCV